MLLKCRCQFSLTIMGHKGLKWDLRVLDGTQESPFVKRLPSATETIGPSLSQDFEIHAFIHQ